MKCDIHVQANESFSTLYSGGRDHQVWATDIRNPDCRELVCEEKAPVLKVHAAGSVAHLFQCASFCLFLSEEKIC